MLTFSAWLAQLRGLSTSEFNALSAAEQNQLHQDYIIWFDAGGEGTSRAGEERDSGDTSVPDTTDTLEISKPTDIVDGTVVPDFLEFDEATGLYFDPLSGTSHATLGEALQANNAERQRLGFQEELTGLQEESQADIERVGAEEAARARQLEAQRTGHALRQAQNALLAQGRSAGEIEQLTAGGIEGAQRSLAGLLTDINLQTQRTQAQLGQQSIGTALTAEGLAGERSRLGQATTQFQQSLEETRRQFGLGQSLSTEQFGATLGFNQAQLAQAQSQFNRSLKETRRQFNQSQPGFWDYFLQLAGPAGNVQGLGGLAVSGSAASSASGGGLFG